VAHYKILVWQATSLWGEPIYNASGTSLYAMLAIIVASAHPETTVIPAKATKNLDSRLREDDEKVKMAIYG
jgi:hypothetical protein